MVEDTMFFPRLRAHARWMFALIAIVFAASFVFLGVGSGAGGIGDLLQGNWSDFFGGGSSGASAQIKKDQKRIDENPKDYAAYRDLAAAQASDDKLDAAIATLLKLKTVNPKDVDGLTQLAGLYIRKADLARTDAVAAQRRCSPSSARARSRPRRPRASERRIRASTRPWSTRCRPRRTRRSRRPTPR